MPRSALVVGATGLVGSHLLDILQKDKDYSEIIVLARRPISFANEKVVQHIIDFDHLHDNREKLKAEDIFCCLGTTMNKAGSREAFYKVDYTYPINLARIAADNNARSFNIVTAMGADKQSFIFYNRVKGEVENAVSSIKFKVINIARPSLILGERYEQRPLEKFAQFLGKNFPLIFEKFFKKYKPIEAEVIARAMVRGAKYNPGGIHIMESNQLQELGQEKKKT